MPHSATHRSPAHPASARANQLPAPTRGADALPVNEEGVGVLADAVMLAFGALILPMPPTGAQRTSARSSMTRCTIILALLSFYAVRGKRLTIEICLTAVGPFASTYISNEGRAPAYALPVRETTTASKAVFSLASLLCTTNEISQCSRTQCTYRDRYREDHLQHKEDS